GLTRYGTVHPITIGRLYATARAPYGRHALALVASHPATRIVRVDRPLVERVVAPAVVSLPVAKGQTLGEVRVYAGSKLAPPTPLVAARALAEPGFLGGAGWYTGRPLHHVGRWFS